MSPDELQEARNRDPKLKKNMFVFANCLWFEKKFLKSFYRVKKSIFDVGNEIIDLLFRPCRQLRGETKNTNARQNMRQKK